MGKFTMTHEIRCNADTFWKTFFDKDFNVRLYKEALGFPDFSVTEQTDDGATIHRLAAAQPKMDVPGPLQKLIGPGFRYQEDGTMKKAEGVWRWKMIPSTLADKLFTSGTVRIEPMGEDKVRRVAEMEIVAKIFAVGGLIESTAEKQMRDGWDRSASFMNKFLDEGRKG
jgi:hypothetical protein